MVTLSKTELLRQLEQMESDESEADADTSQGIEKKSRGKVIRVVQETKRRKNPTQQVRSPAQIAATERMREARAIKLEQKRKSLEPADDEIIIKVEPPKPARKPRKKKVEEEIVEEELTELAPPPPARRSVNVAPKRRKKPEVIYEDSDESSEEEYYAETQPIPIPPPQYHQPPAPSFRNDKRFM